MPRARLVNLPYTAGLLVELGSLRSSLRRVREELQRVQRVARGGHEWEQAGGQTYQCQRCGARARRPDDVAVTCEEVRRRRRREGA